MTFSTIDVLDIVTHYIPPVSGPAWNRIRGFAEEASRRGLKVRFTTPDADPRDLYYSGEEFDLPEHWSINRVAYNDPSRILRRSQSAVTPEKSSVPTEDSLKQRLGFKIRNAMELPDHRRLWNQHAINVLHHTDSPPRLLLTTSPYNSTHLIGLKLKQLFPELHWIADFRDPWDQLWDKHRLGAWHRNYNTKLEKQILQSADLLTYFDTTGIKAAIDRQGPFVQNKAMSVYHGLAHSMVQELARDSAGNSRQNGSYRIVYAGSLPQNQLPAYFFSSLVGFQQQLNLPVQFDIYGRTDAAVQAQIEQASTEKLTVLYHGIQHRDRIIEEIKEADLLLILCGPAKEMISSKVFESIATGNPVLYIGHPESGGANILRNTGQIHSPVETYDETGLRQKFRDLATAINSDQMDGFRASTFPEVYMQEHQAALLFDAIKKDYDAKI